MAYRREDIERVRDAIDLVDLVAEVTKVKRSGRSVMAVCPFHQEKTPSMSVAPDRGLYHCFGCGKSGDIFRFVQETQTLDFTDALELLARRAGVTLQRDPEAAKRRSRRESLVQATTAAVEWYTERLRKASDAARARSYLRNRGYDGDTVETFSLGYSPDDGDALVRALRAQSVPDDVLVTAGLAARARSGRLYDRFRGRVMFPIFDVRGDAVGFGARLLEGDGPKYLNSPETPLYQKSRLLYGLNWAKSSMVREGVAIVVEGYTDVIALHQAGLDTAVATCGTALVDQHVDILRRFTEKVVLMFDADEAGAGAAVRGFEKSVPGDLDLRVAALPPGRDPADLVADGDVDVLRKAVADSEALLSFRIDRELERFDLAEPEARGRAVRAVADLVALHPDPVARHEYAVVVARRTGVDPAVVTPAIEQARRGSDAPPPRERPPDRGGSSARPARRRTGLEKAERELLRLLLANVPGLDGAGPELFSVPEHREAYELLAPAVEGLPAGAPPDLGALLGDDDSDAAELLKRLAFEQAPLPDDGTEVLSRLAAGVLDARIADVRREAAEAEAAGRPEEASAALERLIALERERRNVWSPE
ncbi:MAG: DNA primase [Acidimicrobiia bacterium]|nr:DNA primase [Acidimicrobiia bacterium]